MNSGPTSERVYDALKRRLLSGAMLPDEKLEPAMLAAELNSSVTPVRDVLHRLSGERLVESRPSDGFHLPHVNEPDFVIGVRLRPFGAHSWAQCGGMIVNDRYDHVRNYQPILVI